MKDLGLKRGWVVTTSDEPRALAPEIDLVPWKQIAAGDINLF